MACVCLNPCFTGMFGEEEEVEEEGVEGEHTLGALTLWFNDLTLGVE